MHALSVSDRIAIEALVRTWADHIDHDRFDELIELFTDDGRYAFEGHWDVVGRAALVERYRDRKPGGRIARHVTTNLLVHADGRDQALGEGLLTVYRHVGDGVANPLPDSLQDFRDRYRRMPDGSWRFAERILQSAFVRGDAGAPPR